MPYVPFDEVDEASGFDPLPAGQYPVRIEDIDDDKKTRYDDPMWGLKMRVIEGEFRGRTIYDNMVFSEAAYGRVKLICSRFGLDVSKGRDITPADLIGQTAMCEVEVQNYTDPEGNKKKRNSVPFAGYERLDHEPEEGEQPITDDDIPFAFIFLLLGLGLLA